jgi:hypothetical protein
MASELRIKSVNCCSDFKNLTLDEKKAHRPSCVPACWQTGFHQRGIKKYNADVLRLRQGS